MRAAVIVMLTTLDCLLLMAPEFVFAAAQPHVADSARVETYLGGKRRDRWVGELIVGEPEVVYGASHEFGTGDHAESRTHAVHPAADDLNHVLDVLATAGRL